MKNLIRKKTLDIRNSLEHEYVVDASEKVFNNLKKMEAFKKAKHVMIYIDFKNEISTQSIMTYLLSKNKHIIVPFTNTNDFSIIPALINNLDDLSIGNYGILEPPLDKTDSSHSSLIDLVIAPGIVFDVEGNRIGFGKGYYDSFLSKLSSKVPVIALAYDFQIKDAIPFEPHDIKMDYIITPTRTIRST